MKSKRVDPEFLGPLGGIPNMHFFWKQFHKKGDRLVGRPNKPMRALHLLLGERIRDGIMSTGSIGYGVRKLPSATGCVVGSDHMRNAQKFVQGRFFYITDLKHAYPSVDLERLALLVTFLFNPEEYAEDISLLFFADGDMNALRETPLYWQILGLLECYFSGMYGKGLAIGGPLSPYLMNLYCEVYLDSRVRYWCEKHEIRYTRYVDDLVFSSAQEIDAGKRREIRKFVTNALFTINHRKSKVLDRSKGTVFVTKVGLEQQPGSDIARLVFPQKKRRRLHGAIQSYLVGQKEEPKIVSGLVGEFLYYYKTVQEKTATDWKTFALCKAFEAEWAKYRDGPAPRRQK